MKRLNRAPRCGVLALLFTLLPLLGLRAQPPSGQSGTPQSDAPQQHKRPAQVFVNHTFGRSNDGGRAYGLFCREARIGSLSVPFRLELNSGTYSFTVRKEGGYEVRGNEYKGSEKSIAKAERESKLKGKTVQLEIHEGQQYWIEGDSRGLIVMDPEAYPAEFAKIQASLKWIEMDYTSAAAQQSCPPVAGAAAQPSATPGTTH